MNRVPFTYERLRKRLNKFGKKLYHSKAAKNLPASHAYPDSARQVFDTCMTNPGYHATFEGYFNARASVWQEVCMEHVISCKFFS